MATLPAGSVLLTPEQAAALWRFAVEPALRERRLRGVADPPALATAAADVRAGALHASAGGHVPRTSPDTAPGSELLTTQQAADRHQISSRHLRRIAAATGIQPAARNAWRATDLAALPRPRP